MDTRDKPLEPECHADPISYVAPAHDDSNDVEHLAPYEEDALFKDVTGPVHSMTSTKKHVFWVQK